MIYEQSSPSANTNKGGPADKKSILKSHVMGLKEAQQAESYEAWPQ